MLKIYRLFLFTLLIPILFSGCTIKEWANNMWIENKPVLFGGLIIFFILIFLLIKIFRKSTSKDTPDIEEEDEEEQEFDIEEVLNEDDPDNKTEYLNVDSIPPEDNIEIEKPVQVNKVSVSIKGEKIGTFEITDEGTIIGRDPSKAAIIISEAIVSKTHLKITPKDGGFMIEDLNSTNGTYIDGEQISKSLITQEDTILLGKKGNIAINFE